jgi:hypothetical protein
VLVYTHETQERRWQHDLKQHANPCAAKATLQLQYAILVQDSTEGCKHRLAASAPAAAAASSKALLLNCARCLAFCHAVQDLQHGS